MPYIVLEASIQLCTVFAAQKPNSAKRIFSKTVGELLSMKH